MALILKLAPNKHQLSNFSALITGIWSTQSIFYFLFGPCLVKILGKVLFFSGLFVDAVTLQLPHLMAPPNLVNKKGEMYDLETQRLVPGRENLSVEQLVAQVNSEKNPNKGVSERYDKIIIEPLSQELEE